MNNSNKKIVIFDDDIAILDIFALVFEAIGYEVCTFQSTEDILDKIASIKPNLIIMDNSIPKVGGIEAVRIIKKDTQFKHIPIIFCSANSDISNLSSQAGADAYLSKPFDLDELEFLVAKLLKKAN